MQTALHLQFKHLLERNPFRVPSDGFKPQDNPYEAISGVVPPSQSQMQDMGSVAYEGLKTVLQGPAL